MRKIYSLGFSFIFIYVIIYSLLFPLEFIPYLDSLNRWLNLPIEKITLLIWGNFSYQGYSFDESEFYLSDSFTNYLLWLTKIFISLILASLVYLLKFSEKYKIQAQAFFYTYLRYFLATWMVIYGLSKIFLIQFTSLTEASYLISIGEFTPYELLWAFMEISKPYQIIGGILEVVGGLLLLNRKSTLLGALIIFGVMSNVFMFNLFYGLPVKLISFNFLLFALIIISFNANPLYQFMIGESGFALKKYPSFQLNENSPRFSKVIKGIVIFGMLFYTVNNAYRQWAFIKESQQNILLSGIYRVDFSSKNGVDVSNNLNESRNPRFLIFERTFEGEDLLEVHNYKGQKSYYYYQAYSDSNLIEWRSKRNEENYFLLNFSISEHNLVLRGIWNGDSVVFHGEHLNEDFFPLMETKIKLLRQD